MPECRQRDPLAWSRVPPQQRHVLMCMGPRCNALGASALWAHVVAALRKSGKLEKTVVALQTGCQFPCNTVAREYRVHGPSKLCQRPDDDS